MHTREKIYNALTSIVREYEWIHLTVGIIGNVIFLTGTILFLNRSSVAGWFFLTGSTGMLINSIGAFLAKTENKGKTTFTHIGYDKRREWKEKAQKQRKHRL